jgi:hypothetical protein
MLCGYRARPHAPIGLDDLARSIFTTFCRRHEAVDLDLDVGRLRVNRRREPIRDQRLGLSIKPSTAVHRAL